MDGWVGEGKGWRRWLYREAEEAASLGGDGRAEAVAPVEVAVVALPAETRPHQKVIAARSSP